MRLNPLWYFGWAVGGDSDVLTVQVEGTLEVTDVGGPAPQKLGTLPVQQVFLETIILEVTDRFDDGLGIRLTEMNFMVDFYEGFGIQLQITPQILESDPNANTGLLFKWQEGNPLGQS